MPDEVKEVAPAMITVEKAGQLLQDAVTKTAEVIGETYEKMYDDKSIVKSEPAKVEPTPEIKASSTETVQPEAAKEIAPAVSVEEKPAEQAIVQSTSKEQTDMEVKAETKQVSPGAPDKPLVSGIGKPTEGIKQPKEGLPEIPGYMAQDKPKETISTAKAGKDSAKQTYSGEENSLLNQSDAFIKGLVGHRGLQTGIDMKKKIWAMLQDPKGAAFLEKAVRTASVAGFVRTGAALDFIAAKKKLNTKKPATS